MNKMTKFQVIIGAVFLGASMQVFAIATPSITGEIGMFGAFDPVDSSWNTTSITTATGIDFTPNNFKVLTSSGSFSSIAYGTIGDIEDFQFSTFSSPIVSFWNVGGFSFELTSISKGSSSDSTNIVLEGMGIISAAGHMDTPGTWILTGQTSSAGGVFTWSAGSTAQVSEPTMLALLGIGLIGFVAQSRARKKLQG